MIRSKLLFSILLAGLLSAASAAASLELIEDVSFTVRGMSGQIGQIKFSDINGDGFPEVLASDDNVLVLYSITGDSVIFEMPLDTAYLARPINHRIELADVNRDSVADVVVGYYHWNSEHFDHKYLFIAYDGASQFQHSDSMFGRADGYHMWGPSFKPGITALQALDIDGDGYQELVVSFDSTEGISDYEGTVGSTHLYHVFPDSMRWRQDYVVYDLQYFGTDTIGSGFITTEFFFDEFNMPGVDFSHTKVLPVLIRPDGSKKRINLRDNADGRTDGTTLTSQIYRIGCFGDLLNNGSLQELVLEYHWKSHYMEFTPDSIIEHEEQSIEQDLYSFSTLRDAELSWSNGQTYSEYYYHPGFPGYYFVISGSELSQIKGSDGSVNQTLADLPEGLKDWVYPFDDSEPRLVVSDGNRITLYRLDIATGIDDGYNAALPKGFELGQAYPNPFNAQITIPVNMHRGGHLTVDVINLLGRKVATVHDGHVSVGQQEFHWDAAGFASGIYLFKATTETETATIKATLLK